MVSFCLPDGSFSGNILQVLIFFPPLCFTLPSLLDSFWHSNIKWSLYIIFLMKHDLLTVLNWLEVHGDLGEGVGQGIGPCGIGGVL